MKKLLLGTSAIALAGAFASTANGAEWDVRVGGYHNQIIGYGTSDLAAGNTADVDGVDVKQNGEIFFLPSITLDNGIKFGANVQLESAGGGDTIDESYMDIKGSFGQILLGSENSAGYKMTYSAPSVGIFAFNSPSTSAFVPWTGGASDVFRNTLGSTFIEVSGNNDADRISYFTPRFAGFQVGVSYARDGSQDNNTQQDISDASGNLHDIFDIGANYVNDFGGVNVAVSARWGIGTQENGAGVASTNPTALAFGANVGFGGFTIGGSWAEMNDDGNGDGTGYDVGVSYETGPWGFSATWFHGENVDNNNATNAVGNDEEQDTYGLGIQYKLAKGVTLNGFAAYVDFDEEASNVNDVSGFMIGTGVGLSF